MPNPCVCVRHEVPAGIGLLVEQVADAQRDVHRSELRPARQVEQAVRRIADDRRARPVGREQPFRSLAEQPGQRHAVVVPVVAHLGVGAHLGSTRVAREVDDLTADRDGLALIHQEVRAERDRQHARQRLQAELRHFGAPADRGVDTLDAELADVGVLSADGPDASRSPGRARSAGSSRSGR